MANYINRPRYLQQLIDRRDNGEVKIITGPRRCGKSWLLSHIYKDYLLSHDVKESQIISVSLDRSDAAWKKALKEEQLPWPNGIDKSGIANADKVQTIPAMFLVDVATGKIVGENLRGESLRNKLAELLK